MTTFTGSREELARLMGADTTDAEAEAMAALLGERGITTFQQVSAMSDEAFFGLIPSAIERARLAADGHGRRGNEHHRNETIK